MDCLDGRSTFARKAGVNGYLGGLSFDNVKRKERWILAWNGPRPEFPVTPIQCFLLSQPHTLRTLFLSPDSCVLWFVVEYLAITSGDGRLATSSSGELHFGQPADLCETRHDRGQVHSR